MVEPEDELVSEVILMPLRLVRTDMLVVTPLILVELSDELSWI